MGHGEVLGIDIDIRAHNKQAILEHPMNKRVRMIEGSSIDDALVAQIKSHAEGKRAIVVLDSDHTHAHVLAELQAYAPLVCVGGYCIVMDTLIENMPDRFFNGDRPWRVGDNPKTAVAEYLRGDDRFAVDADLEAKLLITVAPGGYLRRVR